MVNRCAVGFVYLTNAPAVGYIDGFIVDPSASAKRRYRALITLLDALLAEAARNGVTALMANTSVEGLIRIGEAAGFVRVGERLTCLVRSQG